MSKSKIVIDTVNHSNFHSSSMCRFLFKGQLWKHKQKKIYMGSVSVQWSIVSRPIKIRTYVRILTSPVTTNHYRSQIWYIYTSVVSTHYFILVCDNSQIILSKLEQSHSSNRKYHETSWPKTVTLHRHSVVSTHIITIYNFRSSFLTTSKFTSYLVSNNRTKNFELKKYSPNTLPQNSNVQCLPVLFFFFFFFFFEREMFASTSSSLSLVGLNWVTSSLAMRERERETEETQIQVHL